MPKVGELLRVANALCREADVLALELVDMCVQRIPEYAALAPGGNDQTFVSNVRRHLEVFHELLVGGMLDEVRLSFAYRAAAERARQGMALAPILQSYQIVTRGLWHWMTTHEELKDNSAILRECWPVWLDYTDLATRATADAFTVVARERHQADADSRRTVIDMLLSGRMVGREWTQWLGSFGYEDVDEQFCLVVLQWWDDGEYRVVDAIGRTARSVAERLRAATGVAPIDAVRDREVVLLASTLKTTPERIREEVMRSLAVRPSPDLDVSGAISKPTGRAEEMVDAYGQVRRTVAVTRGSGDVALVEQVGLFDHAIAALRSDIRSVVGPRVSQFVVGASRNSRDQWLPTLRAWAESNMNAGVCAKLLHIHRNTVYYRLRQIGEATGVDPQTVTGLADLLVAVRLSDQLDRDARSDD